MTYLKYIKPTSRVFIKNSKSYKLATEEEVIRLNHYEATIKQVVDFYERNLSNDKIDYVYKEKNQVRVLPVKYKKENFPHLTGINFDSKSVLEKFEYLKNGNNSTPIIIERGTNTFKKLSVIEKMPNLLESTTTTLTQLKNVQKASSIGFSRGLKNKDQDLLLALQNFEPKFYQPKSLLNIINNDEFDKVPENTVLGVFREKKSLNGIHIEPISLNKDSLNNMAVTTEMLIGMKKYADELNTQLIKERMKVVSVDPKAQEAAKRNRGKKLER